MSNQITTLRMGQEKKRTPVGDIPIDWGLAPIGEISEINPEVLREDTPPNATFQYIDISSIERLGIISSTKEVAFGTAPSRARRIVKYGDILISTVRPYLQAFARVNSKDANLVASTGFAVIRPKSGIDGDYLWQYVLGNGFVEFLETRMTGSNYPAVNPRDVAEALIALPPILEQKRIAEVLSAVDLAITKTISAIEHINELKEGLMRFLLSNGIGHKKFKETRVGRIPEDWDEASLGDLTTKVGSGITPTGGERVYKKIGRPFLRSQNVDWGHLLLDDVAFIDDETHAAFNSTEILAEDVFLNITGASIGRSAVADRRVAGGNVNQHVCIIRTVKDQLNPYFFNYFLLSRAGQKQIDNFQAGGNRQGLNFAQIRTFRVPRPPLSEQEKIVEILKSVDAQISNQETEERKMKEMKKALLALLLTGKLRVMMR